VPPVSQSTLNSDRPSWKKEVDTTLTINPLTINTDSKPQRQRRVPANTQTTINKTINAALSIKNSLTVNTARRGQKEEQINHPERKLATWRERKVHNPYGASRRQERELRRVASRASSRAHFPRLISRLVGRADCRQPSTDKRTRVREKEKNQSDGYFLTISMTFVFSVKSSTEQVGTSQSLSISQSLSLSHFSVCVCVVLRWWCGVVCGVVCGVDGRLGSTLYGGILMFRTVRRV
jgi:hypothetical protein